MFHLPYRMDTAHKLTRIRIRSFEEIHPEEVKGVLGEIDKWYNESVGGLLISQESRKRFFELREMIDMLSDESARREEVYSEVWRRKMDLRVSLRSDLILEERESYRRHSAEEWRLD